MKTKKIAISVICVSMIAFLLIAEMTVNCFVVEANPSFSKTDYLEDQEWSGERGRAEREKIIDSPFEEHTTVTVVYRDSHVSQGVAEDRYEDSFNRLFYFSVPISEEKINFYETYHMQRITFHDENHYELVADAVGIT